MKAPMALLLILLPAAAMSQSYVTIVYDAQHLAIVNENGVVRLAAEQLHTGMLVDIREKLGQVNINLSSVALVQRMVYRSLTEVDQALKTGRSAVQVGRLVNEILVHGNRLLETAQSEPWLLLFAQEASAKLKDRGVRLAAEVSDFILKEGTGALMDYEKRDQLMRKIILELKVIRALLFSMEKSMYWAAMNGIWKSVNPYRTFINLDKAKAEEIIRNYRLLKK